MKYALIFALAIFNAASFAAPKDALCSEYLNLAIGKGVENVPLTLIVNTLNTAYELGFNAAQTDKLMMALTGAMENNPQVRDTIHNSVYFACTTDLTSEDKATARKGFKEMIGE